MDLTEAHLEALLREAAEKAGESEPVHVPAAEK